tara:strand:+ start:1840 stop:2277 length:438 start_codon:yes stop_codon:yes gene_type:complete
VIFTSHSIDETESLAQKLADEIQLGSVVMLIGDLGTGKTTFAQGFARAIGVSERVGSPTFKLVSEYEGRAYWLYHIDAYRLEGANDFLNIGGEEYLKPEKGVTLIEWANIIGEIFDEDTISIKFSRMKENSSSRKIEIKGIKLDV